MSDTKSVYSIKCTNCAAPLMIRGGGRVTTVTCQYCNSVLDMTAEYKVLSQFHDKYRPPVPFKLGMVGEIKGVEWTIIGWVSYRTTDFPTERWSEFFLYSPLYGYGWLIYEEGVLSFSKRVRDFSLLKWRKDGSSKVQFFRKSHYRLVEEPYDIEIDFVQGELSYVAKADDVIRCWDYDGPSHKSITIEKSGHELEAYQNEKLNRREIYDSFGVAKDKQVDEKLGAVDSMFDEETLEASDESRRSFLGKMAILIVVMILAIGYSFVSSKALLQIDTNQPFTQSIRVDSSAFLSKIVIKAPTPKILDTVKLDIYDGATLIFTIDKSNLYSKSGYIGKTWDKGDDEATIYMKLDSGEYRVALGFSSPLSANDKVKIVIQEKVMRLLYLVIVLVLLFISVLVSYKSSSRRESSEEKSSGKSKYLWWFLAVLFGYFMFGFGSMVFLGAFYLFASNIDSANSSDSDDWWDDDE